MAFLERIKEDFTNNYGGAKTAATTVGPKKKEQMQPDEISELAEAVPEVKGVVMVNTDKIGGLDTRDDRVTVASAQTVLLAFQHYIVMLGSAVIIATALVPRMGGGPGDKARVIRSSIGCL
ncbi:hypothetical protein POM88_004845 [Heracleum sosnowskyi]|uniref:Uncharacterized protein n=1 Tax=Heracleum sosnowskyi TaxID=360622 RepID=A0AAD8N828_9APIA|nr:hypothetical protein POM88_004845 [Heracleum sosnowskyi]